MIYDGPITLAIGIVWLSFNLYQMVENKLILIKSTCTAEAPTTQMANLFLKEKETLGKGKMVVISICLFSKAFLLKVFTTKDCGKSCKCKG